MTDPDPSAASQDAAATDRSEPVRGRRVAVLGAGTMGRGIAQLLLQAGATVPLIDPSQEALDGARDELRRTFEMLAGKGRLTETPATLLGRLVLDTRLGAAADVVWAIEAAPERLELKRALFAELAHVAPDADLATNTSTLSVTSIAAGCPRPAAVIGMHFFNPAPLMRLVEIVPGIETTPTLVARATALAHALGRTPVVAQDRPGFLVNRVARPFYGEALRLAGEGVPVRAIDASLRAAGFRMGPFELLDLIGLDVNLAATISVYEAFFHEPRYRPHPLQRAMVEAGRLGRKRGRGFYRYDEGAPAHDRPGDDAGVVGGATAAPTPASTRAGGAAPRAYVIGEGAVAAALRAALPLADEPTRADLVLDARVRPEDRSAVRPAARPAEAAGAPVASDGPPVAMLCWATSASAVCAAAGARAGFSLVPGAAATDAPLTLEVMAPVDVPLATLDPIRETLHAMGARTVPLPDQAGGAAFRVVALLANEAVSALAERLASVDDIDTAMRLGVNYPRGPLAWAEHLGLADVRAALQGLHQETGAERFAPHPLLTKLVLAGARSFADARGLGVSNTAVATQEPTP